MTTAYDADPHAQTVAAAWASSPLGQPDREVGHDFAEPEPTRPVNAARSHTKHAILAFALAGGVGVGAALAFTFIDLTPADQTVVVTATTSPQPAVVVAPATQAPAPTVLAPVPASAPTVAAPPAIVTPPANAPTSPAVTTVVEIPTPPPADEPATKAPLPTSVFPKPSLPPGPGDFEQPEPKPPVDFPDLPKAPVPKPNPSDFIPDVGLSS